MMSALAEEAIGEPDLLAVELPWLVSDEARAATNSGSNWATRPSLTLLPMILQAQRKFEGTAARRSWVAIYRRGSAMTSGVGTSAGDCAEEERLRRLVQS